jgi:hypothetical protein
MAHDASRSHRHRIDEEKRVVTVLDVADRCDIYYPGR